MSAEDKVKFERGPVPKPRFIEGVNVVGYLTGEMGLGEVARQYTAALQEAGIPVATKTYTHFGNRNEHAFVDVNTNRTYPLNLICLQPLELMDFYQDVGEEFFGGRHTVGVWGWENNAFPEEWLDALDLVDEVWVWTDYVADILRNASSKPVRTVPIPVVPRDSGGATVDLGVPEGFTFLFVFDFHSVVQRKNPLGLVEAFKRAFEPGEGPRLVVKSINGDHHPERFEELESATEGREDIHIVDRYLSGREKDALMDGCDCYVSLHRSEGFGLTPAEAMARGKPVIATNFSGNTDFMDGSNSYLVDYSMTKVGEGAPPYDPEGEWADPDLDHAAKLMREVWENPDEARRKGEKAREYIQNHLSHEAVGEAMRENFERLLASERTTDMDRRIRVLARIGHDEDLHHAKNLFEAGPGENAPSKLGGPGKFVRRLMLRLIRPYTNYQRQFDAAMLEAFEETAKTVKILRAELREQRRRGDALEKRVYGISEGVELGSVPLGEAEYLGNPFVFPHDSEIGALIERGEEWDAALHPILSEILPEEPEIVEVGSNVGASLLQILAARPRARILAVEPSARFLPFLRRNVELAGASERVEILPDMLGEEPGEATLYNNSTTASAVRAEYDGHRFRGEQSVRVRTLDEIFGGRLDFIKTDTDGYEFEALRGAEATIRRERPAIHLELEPSLLEDAEGDLRWLQSLGYTKLVCIMPQGKPQAGRVLLNGVTEDPAQAVEWAGERGLCDILACPEGSEYEARLERVKFG